MALGDPIELTKFEGPGVFTTIWIAALRLLVETEFTGLACRSSWFCCTFRFYRSALGEFTKRLY